MTADSARLLTGTTAIVTGASRGFGHAISRVLAENGVNVVGVARTAEPLADLHREFGAGFTPLVADATDSTVAREAIATYRPSVLVLNAGSVPTMGSLHELTWEEFSGNWEVDTRHAFAWTSAALTTPLPVGSVVVAISSGAALRGSPLSGGYAGAKATIRFISSYAAGESTRLGLGIRFLTVLPQLTPATDLGTAGVAAYARRQGTNVRTFVAGLEPILTPDQVGREILGVLSRADEPAHAEYLLSGDGLRVMT